MCKKLRYPNPEVATWAAEYYAENFISDKGQCNIYICNEPGCDSKFWHLTTQHYSPSRKAYWDRRAAAWE